MTRRKSQVQTQAEPEGSDETEMEKLITSPDSTGAEGQEVDEGQDQQREPETADMEMKETEAESFLLQAIAAANDDEHLQQHEIDELQLQFDLHQQQHQQQQQQRHQPGKLTEILTLNLRGERIYMPVSELRDHYKTLYNQLITAEIPCVNCPNGEKYYDADPMVFRLMLSYYRYGNMHLPSYICGPLLEKEMEFWGVKVTPDCLEACCMHSALESKRWKILLDDFEHKALAPPADDSLIALPGRSGGHRFKLLWNMINYPCSSVLSILYAVIIIACSITSAVMYTMDPPDPCSDWGYRGETPVNCTGHSSQSDLVFVGCQCAFTALFTVDLILRALLAPNMAKFVRSPHTWNDVLSLVPLYGFLLHRMTGHRIDLDSPAGWLFELLSVALFFRVFRILRHFMGIRVMAYTLMTGLSDLMVVMLLVFTATFLFGTVFFLMERSHKDNREKVPTMLHGYYWAVITITTVGYGDITPSTVEGRILAILCSLVGLIVVAFTVPILTENFQRYYGHTCHLSMRGELGQFVLRARKALRSAKRRIYYSSC